MAYADPADQKQYAREHYKRNKKKYKDRARQSRPDITRRCHERLVEYLRAHPCVDCGETDLIVLEFDHVRGDKVMGISECVRHSWSWSRMETEIAKCDVVCANCHRRRTAERNGAWYRQR